ncbi:molybdate ABC transporter substrate-binding protein [Granulicella tundricola]|nr:molybdate ABC transporter substrate-binding protein [Granulicella tundricola]
MMLGFATGFGQQKELRVAAAADLQPVMPVFAAAYEKKTGTKLLVTFGSSSALATQIVNGAPFDVFLGADFSFPERVVAAGLTDEKEPEPYAKGALVLWAKNDLGAPLSTDLLKDPRITRIAVADEFHAPYGRAAYAAMRWLKIFDDVKGKLVVGENIAQTAQFVETGNAQVGFISLTLASSDRFKKEGQFVRVPKIYPDIRQCAVVMKGSPHLAEAKDFVGWMRSTDVQEHLDQFGLEAVR